MAGAAALGGGGWPALSQAERRRYAGTRIEVNLIRSPRGDVLERNVREFTEATGIQVSSEQIPEQQQRQKVVIEMTSGRPSFDVVHVSYHVQKRLFERGNWLADISDLMANPALTEPGHTVEDYSAAGLTYARDAQGRMRSLPWSVDYWVVYWNKELFGRKNIAYPTNFDEMVRAAEALTDSSAGTFGFVARGLRNANVPVWSSFLLGYGGDYLDARGNLLSDSPEAIEAARLYQRLLTRSGPPGIAGFNWMESQAAFLQGRAAMWLDGIGFAPPLEDPNRSRVVGKVGYGVMPRGPAAHASATFGDGIGVVPQSRNREPAYLYCQWAVSKLQGARLLQSGGGVPFRNSVLNDPETQRGVTMPAEWATAVSESAKISKLGLPVVIPVTEYRDIIGTALTATLGGADPATEMRRATEQFKPILERSERS
jgi:multiple sugar transport system substrate-binding protein